MKEEQGFTICKCGDKLMAGCHAQGDSSIHVSIPISCPSGCKPVGIFHTHPGGRAVPSRQDISEVKRLGFDLLCIEVPEKKETKCYRFQHSSK